MATLYDEQGNPVEVADSALTGTDDNTKAELERVKAELERTQQTVTRLSSRPGMEDEPELTPAQEGSAAMEAAPLSMSEYWPSRL